MAVGPQLGGPISQTVNSNAANVALSVGDSISQSIGKLGKVITDGADRMVKEEQDKFANKLFMDSLNKYSQSPQQFNAEGSNEMLTQLMNKGMSIDEATTHVNKLKNQLNPALKDLQSQQLLDARASGFGVDATQFDNQTEYEQAVLNHYRNQGMKDATQLNSLVKDAGSYFQGIKKETPEDKLTKQLALYDMETKHQEQLSELQTNISNELKDKNLPQEGATLLKSPQYTNNELAGIVNKLISKDMNTGSKQDFLDIIQIAKDRAKDAKIDLSSGLHSDFVQGLYDLSVHRPTFQWGDELSISRNNEVDEYIDKYIHVRQNEDVYKNAENKVANLLRNQKRNTLQAQLGIDSSKY